MLPLLLALSLAAPPTLGDALRAIGAFDPPPPTIDHSLTPPPPPPRTGAKVLIGTGAALFLGGLLGHASGGDCATHAADGRCVDAQGPNPLFAVAMVAGLAAAITGSAWYRQDAAP